MGIINNNHWLRTQTLPFEVFLHVSVWITGNGHTTLICSFIYLSVGDLDAWCHRPPASIPRPAALRSPSIFFCLHHSFLSSGYMRWRSRPTGAICRRREKQGAEHKIHILSILTTHAHTHTRARKAHTFECRTVKDRLQHTRECGGFFLKSRWPARYSVTFQGVK